MEEPEIAAAEVEEDGSSRSLEEGGSGRSDIDTIKSSPPALVSVDAEESELNTDQTSSSSSTDPLSVPSEHEVASLPFEEEGAEPLARAVVPASVAEPQEADSSTTQHAELRHTAARTTKAL